MTDRTLLSCIFIVLLLLPVQARSADWLNYVEGKSGDRVYIDMDSIKRTFSNTIRISKKIEFADSSKISSVVSKIEMNCKNSMIRYLTETTYFKDGKSRAVPKNEKFRKITEEDFDEPLMELVCSLKKSK